MIGENVLVDPTRLQLFEQFGKNNCDAPFGAIRHKIERPILLLVLFAALWNHSKKNLGSQNHTNNLANSAASKQRFDVM
jgi:hypothetical protein